MRPFYASWKEAENAIRIRIHRDPRFWSPSTLPNSSIEHSTDMLLGGGMQPPVLICPVILCRRRKDYFKGTRRQTDAESMTNTGFRKYIDQVDSSKMRKEVDAREYGKKQPPENRMHSSRVLTSTFRRQAKCKGNVIKGEC